MKTLAYHSRAYRRSEIDHSTSSLTMHPCQEDRRSLRREVSFTKRESPPSSGSMTGEAAQATFPPSCCPQLDFSGTSVSFQISSYGKGLDLTRDPDRRSLHPLEVAAASKLGLTCNEYHEAKHKIIAKFREYDGIRREFCKTDLQNVCEIDERKASELWVAFNNAGWFHSNA